MISELGYAKRKRMQAVGLSGLAALLFALFIFAIMPAVAWADETGGPEQVVLTWTGDPAVSQAITWLSPDSEANKIQYAEAAGFDGNFVAAKQADAVGEQFAGSDDHRFTVRLTGLDPGTQYFFRVGRDGAWSKNFSFSTSATPDDFAFLYLGDVQEGYAEWGSMVEEIYKENPEIRFALLGGDLTNDGEDVDEWGEFLGAAAATFSQIPMMPAKGNHDGNLFLDFFALPENGPPGVIGSCVNYFEGNPCTRYRCTRNNNVISN
jgi:hypothetical protein